MSNIFKAIYTSEKLFEVQFIDSIQRDFAAGRDAYDDYEMDDYLEDFENYIADKMDY